MNEVIVAVIDSGVDVYHPSFKGRIWENENEIPYDGIDNDGNGYIDDIYGWNFLGEVEKENFELTRKYRRCGNNNLLGGESREDCYRVEKEFRKKRKKAYQNLNYVSKYSNYFGKEAYN
ncbi:MAG: peptidase S8, partial [Bdellovibrionota bacterium]|nr:peptidase S8 [Bdellovibrionota bacterium]